MSQNVGYLNYFFDLARQFDFRSKFVIADHANTQTKQRRIFGSKSKSDKIPISKLDLSRVVKANLTQFKRF